MRALRERYMARGWLDVMEEKRFDPSYDDWVKVYQERYELGRRCAAVWLSLGWPRLSVRDCEAWLDGHYVKRPRRLLGHSERHFIALASIESRLGWA